MITRKLLIFWICFTFANLIICVEVPNEFVQRNNDYYIPQKNNEIPKSMKEYLKLSPTGIDFIGSSKNDTSILITTLTEHEVKWTFCRNDSFQCENKEQELSICYHNGNIVESKHEIDKECNGKNMCQIKVKLSAHENYLFNNHYERGHSFATKKTCYIIHLYSSNNENRGRLQVLYDDYITISNGSAGEACKIHTAKLPSAEPLTYHTEIVVRQGENNDGCNIKMSSYKSHLIIKDKLIVPTSSTPSKLSNILTTTEQSATAKFFDDWIYLIIVIVVIFIIAIIAAIIIKRKWLKKQFQKKKKCVNSTAKVLSPEKEEKNGAAAFDETTPFNSNQQKNNLEKIVTQNNKKKDENGQKLADSKPQTPATVEMEPLQVHSIPATTTTAANVNENVASSLTLASTQASLSCDTTAPKSTVPQKTEAEMTPDELEYLAFSTSDTGKRYRIFRTAVKLAEKTAESHGFSINDRNPTVPGDEEDWLKNHADSLTKTCVEIHGIPVPDIGSTHNEHLDYIDKHSLRDIYLIALYAEVEEPTRMFFLSSVIERFREVIKQIPTKELTKAQHPLPLLLRVYDEHPEVFGVRPRRKNNDNKKK
uniref:SUEL-type lectin domain-containing protein n=1 Tax=Panagrolaimus sp. PS1159 TaxID=55785 RepID=A0AC35G9M8_9BILA